MIQNEISKIDGAKRQIETAIELFFSQKDYVSTVVLTYGAWNLIKDLSKHQKQENSRDYLLQHLQEKNPNINPSDVWKTLHTDWNFFKHAKTDPHKAISIDINALRLALFLASMDTLYLNIESCVINTYIFWFIASDNTPYIQDNSLEEIVTKANDRFPNFHKLSFEQRCKYGSKALKKCTRKR